MDIRHTACLGGGVIGASWTALFLASGRSVAVFDPDPGTEARVRDYIETVWPTLTELGLTDTGTPDAVSFHTSAAEAIAGAGFVQENVPERLPIKHATFAEVEPILEPDGVRTLGQFSCPLRGARPRRAALKPVIRTAMTFVLAE